MHFFLTVRTKFDVPAEGEIRFVDSIDGAEVDEDVLPELVVSSPDMQLMVLIDDQKWGKKYFHK